MTDSERKHVELRAAVSARARALVAAVTASDFNAGQAYDNEESNYDVVYNTSVEDTNELLEYIAELEARPKR